MFYYLCKFPSLIYLTPVTIFFFLSGICASYFWYKRLNTLHLYNCCGCDDTQHCNCGRTKFESNRQPVSNAEKGCCCRPSIYHQYMFRRISRYLKKKNTF